MGMIRSAKGNVFSAPALSAYSNSIVTAPTVFPFAKGIGLMGEAGAEAIMPLRRDSHGRLGVSVSDDRGAGQQQRAPQVFVNIHAPPGVKAETRQRQHGSIGDLSIDVFLEMIDAHTAGGIASNRSKTAHALSMRGF